MLEGKGRGDRLPGGGCETGGSARSLMPATRHDRAGRHVAFVRAGLIVVHVVNHLEPELLGVELQALEPLALDHRALPASDFAEPLRVESSDPYDVRPLDDPPSRMPHRGRCVALRKRSPHPPSDVPRQMPAMALGGLAT